MNPTNVWAVLPAFNEAEALPPLLDAFATVRAESVPNLRVIVVDDGSGDSTPAVVQAYGADWVRLASHATNQGLAQAMRTGIGAALDAAGADDLIVAMDADNTHKPEQIPAMMDRIVAGADVVIGSRFQKGSFMAGVPWYRRLFSWGVSALFRLMTPIPGVRDFSCGYRTYTAHVLREATALWQDQFITENGFACMTEILYKVAGLPGVRCDEIPMALRYDLKPGPTKMPLWRNIRDMLRLMWRHRWRPAAPPSVLDPSFARRDETQFLENR